MNFACALSLRVEEIMDEIRPQPTEDEVEDWVWTDDDEGEIYEEALQRALEESSGIAWAAGNIRMCVFRLKLCLSFPHPYMTSPLTCALLWTHPFSGEYILIIDSDTRVPEDCFLDAASELDASPDIAIIQHESDVMMVIGSFLLFLEQLPILYGSLRCFVLSLKVTTSRTVSPTSPVESTRLSRSAAPMARSLPSSATTRSSDGPLSRMPASSMPTMASPRSGRRTWSRRTLTCRSGCR
jgi:hypothetical protein